MAKYKHLPIGELAHQLKLSPLRLRLQQLDAAEHLVDIIDPAGHYPYEFVCHQVTGYRPASDLNGKSMLGKTLIEDLILLVEDLSGNHVLSVGQMPLRCWTTEELADRLKVSTKTICRWRRRGLPGRKLRYPDGTIRMAFHERSIQRYIAGHKEQVKRGAAFSQLTPAEKKEIVELARQLLAKRRIKLHELSQIVAVKVGRAVETVRYTLRRHDKANPAEALFSQDSTPTVHPELQAIHDAVEAGSRPSDVGRRYGKSAATVRAIVREVRARHLQAREIGYIYNQEFEAPDADGTILADTPEAPTSKPELQELSRDLSPYLRDLYRCPLLTTEQERHLFRKYNYLKFKADRFRKALDPLEATDEGLDRIEELLAGADEVKNAILKANLRLVVSIARRHVGKRPDFFETVSDGNLSLMRAVEKFDYARGFKFSTYASWAIMRNYARTVPEQSYQAARMVTGVDELLSSAPSESASDRETTIEAARHLLGKGLSALSDRERDIVVHHFGLDNGGESMTLEQIGKRLGVTKERIRQIERQAFEKLQGLLAQEHAELIRE